MCVMSAWCFFSFRVCEIGSTCMIPRRARVVVRRGLDGDVLEGGERSGRSMSLSMW
jgi:hypothetical protein